MLSVLGQTRRDLLVSILDNASGDDTERVARELTALDPRVGYHRHDQNIGGLKNIIYGIEQVATPFFSILSDDDLLMPSFFERGLALHERGDQPLAFVSTRIVTATRASRFVAAPAGAGDSGPLRPPAGVVRCLTAGASLPGVIYRTTAMRAIGPPRTAWWNWTESGWHALAALRFPVAFSREVGAIVQLHQGNSSRLMTPSEFRLSWFEMIAELKAGAAAANVASDWWTAHVLPVVRARFIGTAARLHGPDDLQRYDTLARLATASGLGLAEVRTVLAVARAAHSLGIGRAVNRLFDRAKPGGDETGCAPAEPDTAATDGDAITACQVFHDLTVRAGIDPEALA